MKGAIGCLAVVGVGFVLLFGLLWFVLSNTGDQSDLMKQVEIKVTHSEKEARSGHRSGHEVDYTYRVAGQSFAHQTWISNTGWMPGEALSACVDPDAPERHVLRTEGTETCGDDFVGFTVETATPAE
ncbi:hypothetical protein ASG90_09025 [Nocardioides sp. Soil797]|nr:hypothetical protein ASG90_09025 [Nocardioides sp. Soil797]